MRMGHDVQMRQAGPDDDEADASDQSRRYPRSGLQHAVEARRSRGHSLQPNRRDQADRDKCDREPDGKRADQGDAKRQSPQMLTQNEHGDRRRARDQPAGEAE